MWSSLTSNYPTLILAVIGVTTSVDMLRPKQVNGMFIPLKRRVIVKGVVFLTLVIVFTIVQIKLQTDKENEADRKNDALNTSLKSANEKLDVSQREVARIHSGQTKVETWRTAARSSIEIVHLQSDFMLANLRNALCGLKIANDLVSHGKGNDPAVKRLNKEFFLCVYQFNDLSIETADYYDAVLQLFGLHRPGVTLKELQKANCEKLKPFLADQEAGCGDVALYPDIGQQIYEQCSGMHNLLHSSTMVFLEMEYIRRINEVLPVMDQQYFPTSIDASTLPYELRFLLPRRLPPRPTSQPNLDILPLFPLSAPKMNR